MSQIFNLNDRVWCVLYGWGTVVDIIEPQALCCVRVKFDTNYVATYTATGGLTPRASRCLFFKEQIFDTSK